ncbi:MAG TPA: hypothetical protein PKD75_12020 [Tepidiformaceae bacterium]|nr:hypothetical protein [Tepidiformaceae bacterium]
MIRRLFDRKPGYEAQVLAEARALLDDGLELDFVLGLFPEDASWLEGMLETTSAIEEAFAADSASYYFEASLKAKFLAAANRPAPAPAILPAPRYSGARTAIASMGVVSAAAAVGVLALGFVTAGDAVPGDWNYAFKLANERIEYTLSRGDGRVDVQLRQTEARVYELQQLTNSGNVSVATLERLQREARALADLAMEQPLDDVQKARARSLAEQGTAVFTEARKQPDVDPAKVDAAAAAFNDAVATALGGPVNELPTPVATPTAEPTATETPVATTTPEPGETATPEPTGPPPPKATATPEPATTATTQPQESATATATGSATASP